MMETSGVCGHCVTRQTEEIIKNVCWEKKIIVEARSECENVISVFIF